MDSKIQQAKEWAGIIQGEFNAGWPTEDHVNAAAELIQSLPDQWIDAEKVREEAGRMDKGAENSMKPGYNEFSRGYAEAMQECAEHLRNLITPPLPTLADMPPEDREACQWMQARDNRGKLCVIERITSTARVLYEDGYSGEFQFYKVTPRPDLPKLEWPGDGVEDATVVDGEPALPRPEDVPVGEAWLVRVVDRSREFVALKTDNPGYPWAFADSDDVDYYSDYSIVLISRLVPEHKENA